MQPKNSFICFLLLLVSAVTLAQKNSTIDTFYMHNMQTNMPYLLNTRDWWQFIEQKEMIEDYEQLYDTLDNYEHQMKRIEEKFKMRTSEKEKDVPH